MRRVSDCLNSQLGSIYQQALQIDSLNRQIKDFLPSALQNHCQVGSFNKGCLVIMTENALWATELRYNLPSLRDELRQKGGLHQLVSIKIQVNTSNPLQEYQKSHHKPVLSSLAQKAIRDTANLCSYEPLKAILLQLAK